MLGKLAPIVSLNLVNDERTDLNDFAKEVGDTCRRVAGIGTSKSEPPRRYMTPILCIHLL